MIICRSTLEIEGKGYATQKSGASGMYVGMCAVIRRTLPHARQHPASTPGELMGVGSSWHEFLQRQLMKSLFCLGGKEYIMLIQDRQEMRR